MNDQTINDEDCRGFWEPLGKTAAEMACTKVAIDDGTVRFNNSKTDMVAEKLAKIVERAARNRKLTSQQSCAALLPELREGGKNA